jgi:hypothetical protein
MILHIAKLLLSLFSDNMKRQQMNEFRNIHYTKQTKVDVLRDQFLLYFSTSKVEDKLQIESYIQKIIAELRIDFKADENKIRVLDDIFYELKYNSPQKKQILYWIGDL